jgi:hypothetical protein
MMLVYGIQYPEVNKKEANSVKFSIFHRGKASEGINPVIANLVEQASRQTLAGTMG